MQNRWSDQTAAEFVARYGAKWGEDLALRTYTSRLLGMDEDLVLHGGGNTSVKGQFLNILGESVPAIFVKASGQDLATIEPEGHPALKLEELRRLRALPELADEIMANELRAHLFNPQSTTPSIETLAHVFLPRKFIDHTHADSVLALTNQSEGRKLISEALGDDVIVLDYVQSGFGLAKATVEAFEARPEARAMVWAQHGLVTWGDTARESYEAMIELVSRAEAYLSLKTTRRSLTVRFQTWLTTAKERLVKVGPIVRGLLAQPSGNADQPWRRMIVLPLINEQVLEFVNSDQGKEIALTPPLTADYLIRTKPLPLWLDHPDYENPEKFRLQLAEALEQYAAAYDGYVTRHASRLPTPATRYDSLPRVLLLPGLGVLCVGDNAPAARIVHDITAHALRVKMQVARMGTYVGLSESHLFDMEYLPMQQAKLAVHSELPLARHTALITGSAGAIGAGIAQGLLEQGCHVAVTDLPGKNLEQLVSELRPVFGERVISVPLDVTDRDSVARGFAGVIEAWGGVDLLIVNAGIAHVSALAEMDLEAFRRLERVNVEGTLLTTSEAARHFKLQGTGGDIIVVSTKNVFAPGAKFGAYSATKAASHQLARIASLELAEIGVRVNMVAPDAVFSHGQHKSGLWAEVGPDRMRARGLDEAGLEEYYRSRNLLKAKVTARHVANAVLYFATRQTPTTGATIPVDGGLPDATPR